MSLLEDAKKLKRQDYRCDSVADEDIELVLAFMRGDINSSQLRQVKKKDGVQVYSYIVKCLREAWKKGLIGEVAA